MQAEWRAEVEFYGFESGGSFVAKAVEVSCDVRAGAEKVWHHQDVISARFDALPSPVWDGRFGDFQITGHNDRIVALRFQLVGDDYQIVVRFGSAASMRNQQDGSCHGRGS